MTEREKLVELMARAMCEDDLIDPDQRLKNGLLMWQSKTEAALAALTALEAAGVRLVPVEATEEMQDAAINDFGNMSGGDVRCLYRAMLAASPYAPEGTRNG